jgi:hypothetical protein
MRTNETPRYDTSVNTTGCCPKFNPEGWDGQDLHFKDKLFVKAATHTVMHVPVDMASVFARVNQHMDDAGASDPERFIVLSKDVSPWRGEHLFSVTKPVPGEEMTAMTGDFVTKVFEGSYGQARQWCEIMRQAVGVPNAEKSDVYFFYTTCPKCAKAYGRNYVVGVAAIS